MSAQPKLVISEADYVKFERDSTFKNEYYKGEIVSIAGASHTHNLICSNIIKSIHRKYDEDCNVYGSDQRIYVSTESHFSYPDIVVVCGEPAFYDEAEDTITNPSVIIEILSKSTESYDRFLKFGLYRANLSFKQYILVSQDTAYIEIYEKNINNEWEGGELIGLSCSLNVKCLNITIPFQEIYKGVKLSESNLRILR